MRYRIKAGCAALARRFDRGEITAAPGAGRAQPARGLRASECDNPYFKCYGTARRLEELKNKQ